MSRTLHTTPAFPRILRGPRGGRHIAPTPCVECVGFTSCRPGACSAPFGCESWVDEDGRRVDLNALLDDLAAAPLEPSREDQRDGDPYEDAALDAPDTRDAGAHGGDRYQTPAAIALETELEPKSGGFTFETMGGLVKGKCAAPDRNDDEPGPDDPDPYQPSSATLSEISGLFPTDDNDPGPLFGGRGSN